MNEQTIVDKIMDDQDARTLPQSEGKGSPRSVTMSNRDSDGAYLANMRLSMERLARYVELAEQGRMEQLYEELERNTRDPDRHPNQIILGAVLLMGPAFHKGTGRSLLPLVRAAAKQWSSSPDDLLRIWKP